MLHHLDRLPSSVRFGLLPLSFQRFFEILLFVLQQQPGRPADRQPGKPTGCRHCKLSFAFASCSNASSAAADAATAATAQLLAMVKRCSSQSRVAASHRIASSLLCSLRGCVYLLFISCLSFCRLPRGTSTTSGFGRRVWSVFLLCYACRSTIAPLIALISDLK